MFCCSQTVCSVMLWLKILGWFFIVALDTGWMLVAISGVPKDAVEKLGLSPHVWRGSYVCMFRWIFWRYLINRCELVLVSSQRWVCPFHHVIAVNLHYLFSIILDESHFLWVQCAVFCKILIFPLVFHTWWVPLEFHCCISCI